MQVRIPIANTDADRDVVTEPNANGDVVTEPNADGDVVTEPDADGDVVTDSDAYTHTDDAGSDNAWNDAGHTRSRDHREPGLTGDAAAGRC